MPTSLPDLAAAAAELVAILTAADIRASVEAADLNPPCVQLRPPSLTYRFGKGWEASWEAWLLVPDSGQAQALRSLGELLSAVQEALGYRGTTARPDSTLLPDGSNVPTYVLSFTTRHN